MNEVAYLTEAVTRSLIEMLMGDRGLDVLQATRMLNETDTFAKLLDERTGLYRESPAYVYEFLKRELAGTPAL